jgi:hypothetical protein
MEGQVDALVGDDSPVIQVGDPALAVERDVYMYRSYIALRFSSAWGVVPIRYRTTTICIVICFSGPISVTDTDFARKSKELLLYSTVYK